MKLFIASDIHGSMHWCGKMLDAFKKENADKLVNKYKLFGDDPKSLYLLDQELATRVYTAPSLTL